nr:reverse transcriptase domain-containing protein [Tanacetum cinerariifolium]
MKAIGACMRPFNTRPAFYNYDHDDAEDYTIAITPVLPTEEPDNSLSIGDEYLDTILAMKLDEVIKSNIEDLVPIPCESEGILDNMCDVPFRDNSPPLDISKDQFEDFSDSNDDSTSIDDDYFFIDNINSVEASPLDFELVSLEEVEDDILREKLLKIHLFIAKIKSLNDNPTPDRVLKYPSLFPILVGDIDSFFEKSDTSFSYSNNSLPEFETFSDHKEETSSGSTTTRADYSLSKVLTDTNFDEMTYVHLLEILKRLVPNGFKKVYYYKTGAKLTSIRDIKSDQDIMDLLKMNTASSSGWRTLPSNTITNPKEDFKGITTRSGNAYQGPTIPTAFSLPKVVEPKTEVTKDTMPPTNNESTKDVQPPVVHVENEIPNSEPVEAPVSAPKPNPKPLIPYPSRLHDQKLRNKANDQKEKFFKIFQDLDFNISFADALILMPKFGPAIKILLKKLPEKLGDPGKFLIPCDFPGMDECLALADLGASINLMSLSVWNKLSLPELSPTCMTLELTGHDLIDVYEGELTLRVGNKSITFNLDQTSRYSANYDAMLVNRIDLIDVACEEYSQEVLGFFEKSHFMVKEGIVLGHKISKNGIEVDEAKVDVIAKLPYPTTVK